MGKGQAMSYNLMAIVFFIILTFAAWKICKKAGLNPYLSILVFIMAVLNQGFSFLTFIIISIFAAFKIIKDKKPKKL